MDIDVLVDLKSFSISMVQQNHQVFLRCFSYVLFFAFVGQSFLGVGGHEVGWFIGTECLTAGDGMPPQCVVNGSNRLLFNAKKG